MGPVFSEARRDRVPRGTESGTLGVGLSNSFENNLNSSYWPRRRTTATI